MIQDQIPITQNADIEINAIDLDKGELNKKTGIVEWKFSIKPGGKKEIEFKYGVKHDKDKNVVLWSERSSSEGLFCFKWIWQKIEA